MFGKAEFVLAFAEASSGEASHQVPNPLSTLVLIGIVAMVYIALSGAARALRSRRRDPG